MATQNLSSYLAALRRAFDSVRDKYAAHDLARPILQDMADSRPVFTDILRKHLSRPDALTQRHYPVISLDIEHNANFGLVANCWFPLPDGNTNMSTKAIHHHGNMLLTTVTAFGPGYEHWQFSTPEALDPERDLYSMRLLERAPHPYGHASFVDANIGHVPFYVPALTITYALWSHRFPKSWKDVMKGVPALHKHSKVLRDVAMTLGLKKALDLKKAEYFDFCPTPAGFRGMKEREEFRLGPTEDYLATLFHLTQSTFNESLAPEIAARLAATPDANRTLIDQLLGNLQSGRTIASQLSDGHYDVPFANFPAEPIEEALAACAQRRVLTAV
jgi:hypothetical protein